MKLDMKIKLPIFELLFKDMLDNPDKNLAKRIFFKLQDFRFLYNPYELEYIGSVVDAVTLLRNWVGKLLDENPNTKLDQILLYIQDACRKFLSEVKEVQNEYIGNENPIFEQTTNILNVNPPMAQFILVSSLGKCRVHVGIAIAALGQRSKLSVPKNLEIITPEFKV